MKKKPTVWLARNEDHLPESESFYAICLGKKPGKSRGGRWGCGSAEATDAVCHEAFESIAPASCRLPPGGGPIKIDISIKRRK